MICFHKKQAGFSLIELVVVVFLISILLGIGIPAYINSRYKADKQKGIFNLYAIYQAQKMYYFDQEPPVYAFNLWTLTPDYAEFSVNDGTWSYTVANWTGDTYIIQADHMISGGVYDGYWISINEAGSIDDAAGHWPY